MPSSPHISGRLSGGHSPLNTKPYSLKCKGASEEFFSSSKIGFFGWWTAEKKELMGSVHELQLLPFKIRMQENMSNLTYNQADDNFKLYWFKNYLVSNHNNLY